MFSEHLVWILTINKIPLHTACSKPTTTTIIIIVIIIIIINFTIYKGSREWNYVPDQTNNKYMYKVVVLYILSQR